MREFLVELHVAQSDRVGAVRNAVRARRAAESLSRNGRAIRCVRSFFVPEDETCFYIYEADSIDDVREAAKRADLTIDRLAETVTVAAD